MTWVTQKKEKERKRRRYSSKSKSLKRRKEGKGGKEGQGCPLWTSWIYHRDSFLLRENMSFFPGSSRSSFISMLLAHIHPFSSSLKNQAGYLLNFHETLAVTHDCYYLEVRQQHLTVEINSLSVHWRVLNRRCTCKVNPTPLVFLTLSLIQLFLTNGIQYYSLNNNMSITPFLIDIAGKKRGFY